LCGYRWYSGELDSPESDDHFDLRIHVNKRIRPIDIKSERTDNILYSLLMSVDNNNIALGEKNAR